MEEKMKNLILSILSFLSITQVVFCSIDSNVMSFNIEQLRNIEDNLKKFEMTAKNFHEEFGINVLVHIRTLLTFLRDEKKWNQKEIAERFNVSEASVSRFFKHGQDSYIIFMAILDFYKINPCVSLVIETKPPVPVLKETLIYSLKHAVFSFFKGNASIEKPKEYDALKDKEMAEPFIDKKDN